MKVIAHAIGKRAARMGGIGPGAVILKTEQLANIKSSSQLKQQSFIDGERDAPVMDVRNVPSEGCEAKEPTPSLPSAELCLIDIGVDGSVIEFYPRFEVYMREVLRAIEGIGVAGEELVRIGIAKDGSSVGAAIIALIAAQQK